MRRLATVLAVLAVVGVAIAALVDALVGSSPARQHGANNGSQLSGGALSSGTEASLPDCRRNQLALAFENLGGDNAVVLRHARGGACHLAGLMLHVAVVDGNGRRMGLLLGDEAELSGDFSPGFEEVIGFNGCRGQPPLVATATAGPYSATSRIRVGGTPCVGAVQRRVIRLGPGHDSNSVYVQALDPATNAFTLRLTLPRDARIRVALETGSGLRIHVLDAARRDDFCRHQGTKDVCTVPFEALPTERPGWWTVWVRKSSPAPAQVRLSITFEPVD